jgi:glucosamine-6-phosphate deaminase
MRIEIHDTKEELGNAAAAEAARRICRAVVERGQARIIAATGASQFSFLDALTRRLDVPWDKVTMFHLDEYIGVPETHPASFRRYLKERLLAPTQIPVAHLLNPERGAEAECARVGALIRQAPGDVAFVGIGENGHLAFNDPPADFETEEPYLVVNLDDRCRAQQLGEGWFASVDEVPKRAISMSVRQILKSRAILCIVPEMRKAPAVKATLESPVSPEVPASALRNHADTILYLDRDSSLLLPPNTRS